MMSQKTGCQIHVMLSGSSSVLFVETGFPLSGGGKYCAVQKVCCHEYYFGDSQKNGSANQSNIWANVLRACLNFIF
ncbi:MAG: hypothetical protein LBP34_02395 [Flavobacteriaceae bacterium]|jgi:hypothetical protein|nr:hypothetical protein [Flavobacteriaceae bacterium]